MLSVAPFHLVAASYHRDRSLLSPHMRHRIEAVKVLLQRGYGNPPQEVVIGAEASATADELRTMLRENHPEVHQWLHGEEP